MTPVMAALVSGRGRFLLAIQLARASFAYSRANGLTFLEAIVGAAELWWHRMRPNTRLEDPCKK